MKLSNIITIVFEEMKSNSDQIKLYQRNYINNDKFRTLEIFKEYLNISESIYDKRLEMNFPSKLQKLLIDFGH